MATLPISKTRLRERPLSEAIADRRATPDFDGAPIPDEALDAILRAGAEAPSGYNMQPWRFVVVRSPEQKHKLREASFGQPKVGNAGAVIVCCGELVGKRPEELDKIFAESERHGFKPDQNKKAKDMILGTFSQPAGNAMGLAPDYAVWINRHVMIAFTTMMWMAEVLGYDTAPMEGFLEDKVKSALGIPDHVRVVALLAIGRRKGDDKPYAGRHPLSYTFFDDKWGNAIKL